MARLGLNFYIYFGCKLEHDFKLPGSIVSRPAPQRCKNFWMLQGLNPIRCIARNRWFHCTMDYLAPDLIVWTLDQDLRYISAIALLTGTLMLRDLDLTLDSSRLLSGYWLQFHWILFVKGPRAFTPALSWRITLKRAGPVSMAYCPILHYILFCEAGY